MNPALPNYYIGRIDVYYIESALAKMQTETTIGKKGRAG